MKLNFPKWVSKGRNLAEVNNQTFFRLPCHLGQHVCIQFVYWENAPEDGKVDVTSTFSGYKVRL